MAHRSWTTCGGCGKKLNKKKFENIIEGKNRR